MAPPSVASQSRAALHASATTVAGFDASSTQFVVQSDTLGAAETFAGADGLRGTRDLVDGRQRLAQRVADGTIVLQPTPAELDVLLPWIMGKAGTGGVYDLAESIATRSWLVDKIVERFVYTNMAVSRATLSGQQGADPITLSLDVVATDEIPDDTAFPEAVPDIDDSGVYVFGDTTFTLAEDASAADIQSFSLVIDNQLDTGRFLNSVTRRHFPSAGRLITLALTLPWTADEKDLYRASVAGGAGSLQLTNGLLSTKFDFGNLKFPAQPITRNGKGEMFLSLNGTSYRTSSAPALRVTNVSS